MSLQAAAGTPLVCLDIPLLFEKGLQGGMDAILVVSATPEQQRHRVLARPGMTLEKFQAILARQVCGTGQDWQHTSLRYATLPLSGEATVCGQCAPSIPCATSCASGLITSIVLLRKDEFGVPDTSLIQIASGSCNPGSSGWRARQSSRDTMLSMSHFLMEVIRWHLALFMEQVPDVKKREQATHVIDNSKSLEETEHQVCTMDWI